MRDKKSGKLVAVKFIERGEKVRDRSLYIAVEDDKEL